MDSIANENRWCFGHNSISKMELSWESHEEQYDWYAQRLEWPMRGFNNKRKSLMVLKNSISKVELGWTHSKKDRWTLDQKGQKLETTREVGKRGYENWRYKLAASGNGWYEMERIGETYIQQWKKQAKIDEEEGIFKLILQVVDDLQCSSLITKNECCKARLYLRLQRFKHGIIIKYHH